MTREEARAFITAPRTQESKPQVIIPKGHVTISESAEQLFGVIGPTNQLFYRDDGVVELIESNGVYSLRPLDPVRAQSQFEKFVTFMEQKTINGLRVPYQTKISRAIAEEYLKSDECRRLLPRIHGISQSPLLVERDGILHLVQSGYDAQSRIYVANNSLVEEIGIEDAVRRLNVLLEEFDFVSGGDKSRAFASIITPALKLGGLVYGSVPIDVAEANASQAGKTFRQKLVAAIYNQDLAVVTRKSGGVGSMEETFNTYLAQGKTFIQFDNVRGTLDSQLLESFLTAEGSFAARIPYVGSVGIDPSQHLLYLSSNGFQATKDLANRASIVRINKREGHNYRQFDGKGLLTHTRKNYMHFLAAVFALVRHWFNQSKPRSSSSLHDFREWEQVLDWIVVNVLGQAPLMSDHADAKLRSTNPLLGFVRSIAIALAIRDRLGQPLTATQLVDVCQQEQLDLPGSSERRASNLAAQRQTMGKIMGNLFGDTDTLHLEDYRVRRQAQPSVTASGNPQSLNAYVFETVD